MLGTFITGHDKFEELTVPCVESFLKYLPGHPLVIIDSASQNPYPQDRWPGVKVISMKKNSLPAALNAGVASIPKTCDWVMWLNNDTKVEGSFKKTGIENLDPNCIYGSDILERNDIDPRVRFVSSGYFLYPRHLLEVVGKFDERFSPFLWEDADYCMRAVEAGFSLKTIGLPISHIKQGNVNPSKERRRLHMANLLKLMEKWDL
jgi:GT2 family glycosyltransferase